MSVVAKNGITDLKIQGTKAKLSTVLFRSCRVEYENGVQWLQEVEAALLQLVAENENNEEV